MAGWISLMAASPLGKLPRVLIVLRTVRCRLPMALVAWISPRMSGGKAGNGASATGHENGGKIPVYGRVGVSRPACYHEHFTPTRFDITATLLYQDAAKCLYLRRDGFPCIERARKTFCGAFSPSVSLYTQFLVAQMFWVLRWVPVIVFWAFVGHFNAATQGAVGLGSRANP